MKEEEKKKKEDGDSQERDLTKIDTSGAEYSEYLSDTKNTTHPTIPIMQLNSIFNHTSSVQYKPNIHRLIVLKPLKCPFKSRLRPCDTLQMLRTAAWLEAAVVRSPHYLALYDVHRQPLGMAVAEVAGGDSDLLPEQAELELDQRRRREIGGTGGRHCGHGGWSWSETGLASWIII